MVLVSTDIAVPPETTILHHQQPTIQRERSRSPVGYEAVPCQPSSSTGGLPTGVSFQPPTQIEVSVDFTRPDGQRTRPLLVENRRLYVDEHYISVWSPVLRYVNSKLYKCSSYLNFSAWCVECPDRELILANVQYEHVLEMLECIHPTYKAVDDQSVHILLPLAYDYQVSKLKYHSSVSYFRWKDFYTAVSAFSSVTHCHS